LSQNNFTTRLIDELFNIHNYMRTNFDNPSYIYKETMTKRFLKYVNTHTTQHPHIPIKEITIEINGFNDSDILN